MELEAKLARMYANRTVFYRAVVGSLSEDRNADVVFGQFMAVAVQGALGHVGKKFPQAS
jgi:hypothetical protein